MAQSIFYQDRYRKPHRLMNSYIYHPDNEKVRYRVVAVTANGHNLAAVKEVNRGGEGKKSKWASTQDVLFIPTHHIDAVPGYPALLNPGPWEVLFNDLFGALLPLFEDVPNMHGGC